MAFYASVSFGKDSLAMLLLLLEKKMPLDEVIFLQLGNGISGNLRYPGPDKAGPGAEGRPVHRGEAGRPFFIQHAGEAG